MSVENKSVGSGRRRILRGIIERLLLVAGALLICELLLRAIGRGPAGVPPQTELDRRFDHDPIMGWRHRPGVHKRLLGALETTVTIMPDSTRSTGRPNSPRNSPAAGEDAGTAVFLGDSFMAGANLEDRETIPAVVHEQLPNWRVLNFGVDGYGTCQMLAWIRAYSPQYPPGTMYVYGFNDFHETRTVGDPAGVWALAKETSSYTIYMPFCEFSDSGEIVIRPPEDYRPRFPWLVQYSALGTVMMDFRYEIAAWPRRRTMRRVTEQVLSDINRITEDADQKFVVLLMDAEPEAHDHYRKFLEANKIRTIDGWRPDITAPELRIPNDGHPNAKLAREWGTLTAGILADSRKSPGRWLESAESS